MTNVLGGFAGSHDGDPGAVHSALPVETVTPPGGSYALRVDEAAKTSRVISRVFHLGKRRLASASTNRSSAHSSGDSTGCRPVSIPDTDEGFDPAALLRTWGEQTTQVSERFYDVTSSDDYRLAMASSRSRAR